jgi:hypothetical protein
LGQYITGQEWIVKAVNNYLISGEINQGNWLVTANPVPDRIGQHRFRVYGKVLTTEQRIGLRKAQLLSV